MTQFAFSFDESRCSGCYACVVACQDQNDHMDGDTAFRQVVTLASATVSSIVFTCFSISCFHCGDAPCLKVCPTGAIRRRSDPGNVEVDTERCIGCHSCLQACPFGAPQFTRDGKMAKCDLCSIRLTHGLKPACVSVCSTNALEIKPLADISRQKAQHAANLFMKTRLGKDHEGNE